MPPYRIPSAAWVVALAAVLALAGCASTAIDDNVAAARGEVQARTGADFAWLTSDAARTQARADVDDALGHPLGVDDAVRIALAHDPALQAALFRRAAESADATQSARPANPVFEFERLSGGVAPAHVEVTRTLTLPLLDLLLLPARARVAQQRQQALRLQLAGDVLAHADGARRAWVTAVAARAHLVVAQRVQDAAEAGAELARRLEGSGAYSALDRAREEAFGADAATALAQARRDERASRAALVTALGLDAGQAARLALPEELPAPPASAPAMQDDDALQAALDQRLDLRLARARLDAEARAQGLASTGVLDALALGPEHRDETGAAKARGLVLSVPLPVFDSADAARAGANARVQAARQQAAAVAVAAAAQLRRAQGDRADAWALARDWRERVVPLQSAITRQQLLRYNGMLASPFELLEDARAQARAVQQSIAAQRDWWLSDAAFQAATLGLPAAGTAAISAEAP